MFNNTIKVILLNLLLVFFYSCKKHDTLPELDGGNDANPNSGVELAKLDSFRIYAGNPKYLRTYISLNKSVLNSLGIVVKDVLLYKNGNFTGISISYPSLIVQESVVSGQIVNYQYKIVDTEGRGSKLTTVYTIHVP